MNIYFDKIKKYRKKNKISIEELSKELEISTVTFWNWKIGKFTPSENTVRQIAKILNVTVNEISDLEPNADESEADISESLESWLLLGGKHEERRTRKYEMLNKLLKDQQEDIRQASILINAITSSLEAQLYIKDNNLKFILANKAFLDLISFKDTANIKGMEDSDFFVKNEASKNTDEDLKVLETAEPIEGIEGYIPGSRKQKICLIYKYPITDVYGKVAGVIGLFIDISKRKEHEHAKKLLMKLIDSGSDAYYLLNKKSNKYFYVSKSVEGIYGYPVDSFYNNRNFWFDECIHTDYKEQEIKYRQLKKWPNNYTVRIVTASGDIKWIDESLIETEDYILNIEKDITKNIEEEGISNLLKKSIDNSDETVCLLEKKTNTFIYVSKSIKNLFGYEPEEVLSDSNLIMEKCYIPDNFNEKQIKNIQKGEYPTSFKYRAFTKTGKIIWAENKYTDSSKYVLINIKNISDVKKSDFRDKLISKALETNKSIIYAIDKKHYKLNPSDLEYTIHRKEPFSEYYIIALNDAHEAIYKYPIENFTGKKGSEFWLNTCVHQDYRKQENEYLKNASWPKIRKYKIIRADGEIRTIESKFLCNVDDFDIYIDTDIS